MHDLLSTSTSQSAQTAPALHGGFWVHPLCRMIARVYFGRPRIRCAANLPSGAALLASNHRSGAIDGMLLAGVGRRWIFMVGANLARHPIMRHLVAGLVVERVAERAGQSAEQLAPRRAANQHALDQAAILLAQGRTLCVFPEGTSALGPALLPLHHGVAALYLKQRQRGGNAPLIPIGLHYAHGAAFRGQVEVTIGQPVAISLDASAPAAQRHAVIEQLRAALAGITVNVRNSCEQQAVEALATLATAGTNRSHGAICRALAHGLARDDARALDLIQRWQSIEQAISRRQLASFASAPLYPRGSVGYPALIAIVLAPVVAVAALINAPILFAANRAAHRYADAENVVALWRALAGLLVALIWWLALIIMLVAAIGGMLSAALLALALLITWAGLHAWRPWRMATVELVNTLRAPALGQAVRALREETLLWFVSQ